MKHLAEWPIVRLAYLGEVNRGRSRHRPRYAEHLYGGPYPFIQTGDIKASSGRITTFKQTYSEAGLAQSRLWPSGTMCITIAANIAETAVLTFPACFPDSVVGFIPDQTKCDVHYIEYLFRHLRAGIQFQATGSVQDNINLETLGRLRFPLPSVPEQRAIAQILGTLDDKIELNRRMNETLEAMARAIFKSWFVDFDPVRAKAEGRQPFGMDAATAALFPDSVEDSPLGKIPKGWQVSKLSEICEFTYGKALKEEDRRPGFVPVYGSNGQIGSHDEALAKGPGIVIGRKGNPGFVRWVARDFFAIDTTFFAASRLLSGGMRYLFYRLASLDLPSLGADSAVPGLNRNIAYMSDVLVPSRKVIEAFERDVEAMWRSEDENTRECHVLAALRDVLLPKLISGEIRVTSARPEEVATS